MRMLLLILLLAIPVDTHWWAIQATAQSVGADSNLRALSIYVSHNVKTIPSPVIWASGSNGVILRSIDNGATWQRLHISDADKLDFRGIQAVDANTVYIMSIGEGESSRIYKTTDSGKTWVLQYTGNHPTLFLDALACISPTHCFAVSDPVDGKFFLLTTEDGAHWRELPRDHMPPALPNEGIFAASNSSLLVTAAANEILFATGGPAARLFRSTDLGRTWTVHETPITHANASSGIFSITRVKNTLIAVGGDYKSTDINSAVSAYSLDDGLTWHLSAAQPGGFRSAVAGFDGTNLVAVGPKGTDLSSDGGIHWQHTDALNLNAVACDSSVHLLYAGGAHTTIAHFQPTISNTMEKRSP
jgi:photosystem II stability/assembly factor-like uncharacterized protein